MEKLFRQKVRLWMNRSSPCRINIVLERRLKELQELVSRSEKCNSSSLKRRMAKETAKSVV
jgi:hypothetical protein